MNEKIAIVDRGRGWQLSTSRVTVQDLVPYFQEGRSHEEIIRWIPTLSDEEIAVVEQFYNDHKQEMNEQDRRIRERNAQRRKTPEAEEMERKQTLERLERARQMIRQDTRGRNGDHPAR
jgi:uncharacterized protein (DUF433 family)